MTKFVAALALLVTEPSQLIWTEEAGGGFAYIPIISSYFSCKRKNLGRVGLNLSEDEVVSCFPNFPRRINISLEYAWLKLSRGVGFDANKPI